MELNLTTVKSELIESLDAINQSRSNYQIEKFVIGEHTKPERQFQQCVLELKVKLQNIKREELNLIKHQRKLAAETDDIEKALIALDIEDMEYSIKSQKREAGTLYAIYTQFPKFTYQQLQEAEESYWFDRLGRQAEIELQSTGRVGQGNLDALRMIGAVQNNFAGDFYNKLQLVEEKTLT